MTLKEKGNIMSNCKKIQTPFSISIDLKMFCLSLFNLQLCLLFSRKTIKSYFFSQIDVICVVKMHQKQRRFIDDSFKLFFYSEVIHSEKRLHSHIRLQARNSIKKRLLDWCFPVKFTKFLKTSFLLNTSSDCFCSIQFMELKYQILDK